MRSVLFKKKITFFWILFGLFFVFNIMPSTCEAHVLIIADGDNSTPALLTEGQATATALKSQGYNVLELYRENATTKNIMKGMYNADALIYLGHGGYMTGNYNNNGGSASPPFALVGSDGFVWGIEDKLREGWDGKPVTAPFKPNIPVILAHACFSTGWVGDKEVSNPVETIYNFSLMFTGAGANYYATGYTGSYQGKQIVDIIDEFLNGATSFADANQKNTGKTITKSSIFNGQTIWRNDHGYAAFVGDWNSTFPKATQTTLYDEAAAESWYHTIINGNQDVSPPTVTSTNPANLATSVPVTLTTVTINFNENIMAGANFAGVYIKNLSTDELTAIASKTINGNILTITPANKYLNNNSYLVYLPAGAVKDTTGNNMAAVYSYQFKTIASTADTTPPAVTSTNPVSGATGVSTTSRSVTITFSENIQAGANFDGIYIKNLSTGKTVAITSKTITDNILTITQTNNRLKNSNYQVYIPKGAVKDISENNLASAYSYQFKTGTSIKDTTPPIISSTNPLSGATGVSITSKTISITFNENIMAGANFSGIYIKNLNTGKIVSITSKTISGSVLNIKQTYNRVSKNIYKVYIPAGGVKDAAGNSLTASYSFQFKTI
ncbi:MAG: Copper resistance protein CopC [Methanobacterium sp. PtaU1.Bin242]|nr:MAG: Copper resistance protein CopC [Methanobacterium sp. PtaU1.Bin242]